MRGYVIKCRPLPGRFELYMRSEIGSIGPVYVKVPTKHISTRKFMSETRHEADDKISELIAKCEQPVEAGHKKSGRHNFVIELRGDGLEHFLERHYPGCFHKASNADYLRAVANFPFFPLEFDDTLLRCFMNQQQVHRELRRVYEKILFPMRLQGKSHKDILKLLKKPGDIIVDGMNLKYKIDLAEQTREQTDVWLQRLDKENYSEIEFLTLKIHLNSYNGITFENET
ncbi:hypothetical protein KY316_00765 [Candidatus Woesearchaeota archaeon]|nr:hypothetical protein [Candidatus Woesearchaeota archaeon]